jgi:hypothetical protein
MSTDVLRVTNWHGCYDDSWKGIIVEEAFAHPAKFAYGLITRIIDHGLRQGYWKPGDLIGDPFGGVALGGIAAGCRGLNWVGVELEQKFVDLGNQNLAAHGPAFMASGASMVKLVQGDSRRFAEIVGRVCGVISSPPFAIQQTGGGIAKHNGTNGNIKTGQNCGYQNQAATDGNIAGLQVGRLDAIVSSPPWMSNTCRGANDPIFAGKFRGPQQYSEESPTDGRLGGDRNSVAARKARQDRVASVQNIGEIVSQSGASPTGLVNVETYWQAMHAVYSQMLQAMNPGAVAAIVVKDYVSKGKRVPLCDDTCRLLEHLGFTVFERTRCWLVKEHRQPGLFGGEHVERTERKSFFRRLAEKKGSPRIDWEEVIWARS